MKHLAFLCLIITALYCSATLAKFQCDQKHMHPETITPLTEYVCKDDGHFHWNISDTVDKRDGVTIHNIYMTSQKWLTEQDSDNSIWRHWLQICVPDNLPPGSDIAFLYVGDGKNKRFDQPPSTELLVVELCRSANTIGAALYQIPNQPVRFAGDPNRGRSEDAMIAYTWSHFVNNTNEPDWLARMPMTKAGIKAMDAMQEFVLAKGITRLNRFVVAGASKRGWTTWTMGAMGDERIVGLIPLVAPIANLRPQMNEMYRSFGTWSFALKDYTDMNLMGFLNTNKFEEMLDLIDPRTYKPEMARVPKLVIGACGDEFFMLDSAKFYWDDIPGENYLRMIPNAEHTLINKIPDVIASSQQFYLSIVNGESFRPEYSWDISEDGTTITVQLDNPNTPGFVEAKAWYSANKKGRDWRLAVCGEVRIGCANPKFWASEVLKPIAPGTFSYTMDTPTKANTYTAFLIELSFNVTRSFNDAPMKITSDVSIIPKTFPYPPCPVDVCACGYDCKKEIVLSKP